MNLEPGATIQQARDWLRRRLDGGAPCPVCGQRAQMYRRKLNSGMARALIELYRVGGVGWVHKPTALRGLGAAARDESLLRFWGLVEEERAAREDGGRAGWWRVTPRGERFVRGTLRVPRYVKVYDGRSFGLEGEPVSIRDCLGDRFDYNELMRGLVTS